MNPTPVPLPESSQIGRRAAILSLGAGFGIFLLLEALFFHTRLYTPYLQPDSSTGLFELTVTFEQERPRGAPHEILAVGDSRLALRPFVVNSLDPRYGFSTVGVGGTTPRVWYYLTREVDPNRDRYAAIVLPVDEYEDIDTQEEMADRLSDAHFLAPYLSLADIPTFAGSYGTAATRLQAARSILFKGLEYKLDMQRFLQNPAERFRFVKFLHDWRLDFLKTYPGPKEDLAGLKIDFASGNITYPERLTPEERQTIKDVLLPDIRELTGHRTAYRRAWYGRLLERYRGTPTKIVFLRVPRGPVVGPPDPRKTGSAVREMASHPNAVVLDEHLMDELERPELFKDPLHLNAEGCRRFSLILAKRMIDLLGGGNAL